MKLVNLFNLEELKEARDSGVELKRVPVLLPVELVEKVNAKCLETGKQFSDFIKFDV